MRSLNILRRLKLPEASNISSLDHFKGLFTHNLSLKIFALGLAILVWGFVVSQKRGESTEIKFTAPLVLKNIPTNLEVTSSVSQSVAVLVEVRRGLAKSINPNQFQVGIDLRNQFPGEYEYKLSKKNIFYKNESNPAGILVLQISPNTIPLHLEKTIVMNVPIRPRFSGDLAKGFIMESITLDPPRVELRGPGSVLPTIKSVPTQPLDVQELNSDVEMMVNLDLPALIRLSTPKESIFKAYIKVSNNPEKILFLDIPVVFENARFSYTASINKLNVHVEGPKDIIDLLEKKDVFAVVNLAKFPPGDYRGLTPKVILPESAKVLEQWPILDLFILNKKIKKTLGTKSKKGGTRIKPKKKPSANKTGLTKAPTKGIVSQDSNKEKQE